MNRKLLKFACLSTMVIGLIYARAPSHAQQPEPPAMPPATAPEQPAMPPATAPEPPPMPTAEPTPPEPMPEAVTIAEPSAQTPSSDAAPQVIPVTQPPMTDTEAKGRSDELISITLDDVQLVDVVRMFTRISGANIIASAAELNGTVTVNLQDVKWRPALVSILDMHGLTLVEKELGSGVFSIVPRPENAPIPMITTTFQLKFAVVPDVMPIVQNMLAPGGSLTAFSSRNMLVVRSTAENLSEIHDTIESVDRPTRQVCIETKFMELTDQASKQLGIRWDSLAEFGVRLQAGPFAWDRATSDTLTREDSQTRWNRRNTVDTFTPVFDKDGVQYNVVDAGGLPLATRSIVDTTDSGQNNEQSIVRGFSRSIEESQSAILEMDELQVVLSALQETDGVSIVSNPKMIVANGATNAMFSVGEREPIIRVEVQRGTTESPGDTITAQLDTTVNTEYITEGYLATGIDLYVVPVVKTDDLIEAYIAPSLRRKTGDKTVGDNSWPIISVKEIKTRFTLRSRQTVAIGGLTDTQDMQTTTKVPLLGDIPLIGKYLFSHQSDVKRQVETIIFVTLSLAEAETLYEKQGIPEGASLVHKRMIQDQTTRQALDQSLDRLQEAADSVETERQDRSRARLLKRRK